MAAKKKVIQDAKQFMTAGWSNLLSGMGLRGRDPKASTFFQERGLLAKEMLSNMYDGEGFARRIVDLPAAEMTRQWLDVEGDTDGLLLQEFERLELRSRLQAMARWNRLYGGAVAILGVDDGQSLDMPIAAGQIRDVSFIHVFDRYGVSIQTEDYYKALTDKKYGLPQYYRIRTEKGTEQRVHEERVIRLDGLDVSADLRKVNNGWGGSALQACYNELKNLGSAHSNSASIVSQFIIKILKSDIFPELMAAGKEDVILKRMDITDMTMSVINTMFISSNEEISVLSANVAGLPQLLEQFVQALAAVTGIPVTLLMGQSPAGLQATGDADIRFFYDRMAAEQRDKLTPLVMRVAELLLLRKDRPISLKREAIQVVWKPLWQMTAKEEAEYRKLVAETDQIYMDYGALAPEEVRESRFGGEHYSAETALDPAAEMPEGEKEVEV